MSEVGTLKELDLKPGDVVELQEGGTRYTIGENPYKGQGEVKTVSGFLYDWREARIISRANTPKLWRDMTDAEKGALLLAYHEGKVIENKGLGWDWIAAYPCWDDRFAYRVRPEPKVEVVRQGYKSNAEGQFVTTHSVDYATHVVTFNTIDGKPDCTSVKMEAI